MNIVVTNLKGGVGKTTTTVYLAAVAAERGHTPVVVVDADRQASAAEWLEERPLDDVEVIEAPSERTLARAMRADEGTVVVDLPPGDERLVQSAITAADAIVIPTRAGGVEFARVAYTLGVDSREEAARDRDHRGASRHERPPGDDRLVDEGEGAGLGRRPGARRHRRRPGGAALPRRAGRVRQGAAPRIMRSR